jgi:hypothetical protein
MVIFCIPAVIKVARIVLKLLILVTVARKTTAYIKEGGTDSLSIGNTLIDIPTIKIEACCALVDHMSVIRIIGIMYRSLNRRQVCVGIVPPQVIWRICPLRRF